MQKQQTPRIGQGTNTQGKNNSITPANNNLKTRISQGLNWLLFSVGFLPWMQITLLIIVISQEVF